MVRQKHSDFLALGTRPENDGEQQRKRDQLDSHEGLLHKA